jgi:chemotaxis regulatin CheY-phosphate phosphatase CheZ
MMEKEFKELLKSSKEVIGDVEKKVADVSKDLPKEMGELWEDIQKSFTKIKDELLEDDHKEKAQEKVLEAKEKLNHVKESVTQFASKFKDEHQADLDIAALRAHLAKMEAEDFLEESRKKVSREVQESSHSLEKLALDASKEIKDFFSSLSEQFNKKA